MSEVRGCTGSLRSRTGHSVRSTRLERQIKRNLALDPSRADLFMRAADPMVVIHTDGHYLDANDAARRLLGYSRDELLRCTAQQINRVSDEVWQVVVANTNEVSARLAETVYYSKDGAATPVEVSVRRIVYRGCPAILSVARDITERKAAEAQLVLYNMRLSSLASGAAKLARRLTASEPASESLEQPLLMFIEQARRLVPFDNVTVAFAIPGTQWLTVCIHEVAGRRVPCVELLIRCPAPLEGLPQSQALLLPGGASLQNLEEGCRQNDSSSSRMGLAIPLRKGTRLLGALSLGRSDGPGFTRRDADALRGVAYQMAIAIDCADTLDGIRAVAVSEERLRIGREMHDRVGQSIALASAFSSEAGTRLRMGHSGDAEWAIGRACHALQQANEDLRESIFAFRSIDIGPEEWVEGLQEYVDHYERTWGIKCKLEVTAGAAEACGAQGRVGLARILQEALTNVRKHANTRSASVSIKLRGGAVLAQVEDEGQGFNPSLTPDGHFGLQTMKERACGLGGELHIVSGDSGTQLSIRLPAGRLI